MSWPAPRVTPLPGGGHCTYHIKSPVATSAALSVDHDPSSPATHHINVAGRSFMWPSARYPDRAYTGEGTYGPAPSEELLAGIEQHHRHANDPGAWMGLLDRLAEEYPVFDHAVTTHTNARSS